MPDADPPAQSTAPLSEPSEPEPGDDTWPTGVSPSLFPDPERIGRFVVRRRLGAGGMGIVYAAHDEELDRTIAIKLLLHDSPGRESSRQARRDRLRREAQILARLSHPNVVPVYEVGEHDGTVFVVMEYVRGTTLQAWVEEDEPSWREVLQAYLEAGRGLSAAHRAGVVHRDFKPANVLRGRDGRIVVVDFGLARTEKRQPDPAESLVHGAGKGPPSTLTGTGTRIGTPGYMAPEQIRGGRGDERSDQFAFAVALWEALYDEHPFGVRAWPALAVAVVDGALHLPADPGPVPVAVQRVLERALDPDPDARWPDLPELLAQLREVGWPRKHRRLLLGGAAVGSLVLASAVGYFAAQDDVTPGCGREADAHIAAVWSDVERDRLGSRYVVTGQPHVEATWTFVQQRLDGWLARWSTLHAQTCGPVGEQTDPDLRRRRALCLDAALDSVNVLRVTMTELDPLAFANGDAGSMLSLADLSLCEGDDAVSRRLPEPETAREDIREVRAALAQGRVLSLARNPKGASLLETLPAQAEATGYPPLQAEVAYARAQLEGTEQALRDVVLAAERFGNDTVLAQALLDLAAQVDDDDARHLLARAEAAVERAGAPLQLRLATAGQKADLALARGELDDAQAQQQATLAIVDDAGLLGTPQHAWARLQLGRIRVAKGEHPVALEDFRAAVSIYEGALGPDHPELVWALGSLADLHDTMQHPQQGDAVDTRILALLRRTHPDLRHPELGHAYYREAIRRFSEGESYPLAIEFASEAVDVMSAALGRLHPATQKIRYYLARIRVATGSVDDARTDLAVLLEEPRVLDERVKRVDAHGMDAVVRARLGDRRGARRALEAATESAWAVDRDEPIDPLERAVASAHLLEWSADVAEAGGAIGAALAYAELSWAMWATLQHKHRDRSLYRTMTRAGRLRALAGFLPLADAPLSVVVERADADASPRWPFIPDARFALAQVRLATGDLDDARTLAKRAHEGFVAVGRGRAAARDEVAAWIASLTSSPEPDSEPDSDPDSDPDRVPPRLRYPPG